MKKSIIATGAASLALAAMPVVGVFAEPQASNTITDHITVEIPASCTIQNDNYTEDGTKPALNNYLYKEIPNGQYQVITGSDADPDHTPAPDASVQVICNSQSGSGAGWYLTAIGDGDAGYKTSLHDGTKEIPSAATSVTAAGGATSDWSFSVKLGDNVTPGVNNTENFVSEKFYQIPASEMNIATGTGSTAAGAFEMKYGVYVSPTQASGTYTGAVKYTLYNPAS